MKYLQQEVIQRMAALMIRESRQAVMIMIFLFGVSTRMYVGGCGFVEK